MARGSSAIGNGKYGVVRWAILAEGLFFTVAKGNALGLRDTVDLIG